MKTDEEIYEEVKEWLEKEENHHYLGEMYLREVILKALSLKREEKNEIL